MFFQASSNNTFPSTTSQSLAMEAMVVWFSIHTPTTTPSPATPSQPQAQTATARILWYHLTTTPFQVTP